MSGGQDDRQILVFLRSPRPGRVKTRLARELGVGFTLALYRCFVQDLLATAGGLGMPMCICFHPAGDRQRVRRWLGGGYAYRPQHGNDLGERMAAALGRAFDARPQLRRAVLVGTDVPDLPGDVLREAFGALRSSDAVLGPTVDGGYYLVGFTRDGLCEAAFHGISWGTSSVLQETLAALDANGRSCRLLRPWRDVDEPNDLIRLQESVCSDPHTPARRTAALLASRPNGDGGAR